MLSYTGNCIYTYPKDINTRLSPCIKFAKSRKNPSARWKTTLPHELSHTGLNRVWMRKKNQRLWKWKWTHDTVTLSGNRANSGLDRVGQLVEEPRPYKNHFHCCTCLGPRSLDVFLKPVNASKIIIPTSQMIHGPWIARDSRTGDQRNHGHSSFETPGHKSICSGRLASAI